MPILQKTNLSFIAHSVTENPNQESFYKHSHNDYELFFFIRGDAEYVLENRCFTLKPYTLLFIKPAVYHYLRLKTLSPYERFIVNFSPKIVPAEVLARLENNSPLYRFNKNSEVSRMFLSAERKYRYYRSEDYSYLMELKLREIILSISYSGDYAEDGDLIEEDDTLNRIINFINGNLNRNLSLDTLSQELFLSKSHISHLFSDKMRIGIIKYIREKQLLYAQKLIRDGCLPTEVYKECGFEYYSSFYRAYLSYHGINPARDR